MSRRAGHGEPDHPVLAGLDPQQRAVATSLEGPVVVLAGAGTGKTRAMTHRIAYGVHLGVHEASRSMALTFTTRAAGEMRSRLRSLGAESVAARTFHAAALRQLRHFLPRVSSAAMPQVLASKARLVAEAAASCGVRADSTTTRDLAADIEWAKAHEWGPENLVPSGSARPWSLDVADVTRVYAAYEELKDRRGLMDFEDVLLGLVGLLRDNPRIASEVRAAYRWFTVDEYQDVNHVQHELLRLWLGDRDDLCVVGDASQTIYSFTGATSAYLTGFATEFPQATQVQLVTCYRCTQPIVDLANAVIGDAPGALQLQAVRRRGAQPAITAFDDDVAEAAAVAEQVRALIEAGTQPAQIAVLFRINAQSAELESAFIDRGIPVVVRGGERFFERAEIKDATVRLRAAARGQSTGGLVDEVQAVLAGMGWSRQPPRAGGAAMERWESLAALAQLALEWSTDQQDGPGAGGPDEPAVEAPGSPLAAFVAELDRRAQIGHVPQANAVSLASLHAAKGLEWDVVFIVGCSEGLLPIHYAQGTDGIAEERRLAYVGITRAQTALHLSWARARQPGGRPTRQPSRFLQATAPDGTPVPAKALVRIGSAAAPRVERAEQQRRGRGPAKCRICRKALVTAPERTAGRCRTCPATIDEALVERIRQWRLLRSRELGVPAYVVCTDATLLAVAEQRPQTAEELLEITGLGPRKVETFGEELLALLRSS